MTAPNPLRLEPLVAEDMSSLVDIFFTAFKDDDVVSRVFPDTPSVRAWWQEINTNNLLHSPTQQFTKVVDPAMKDAEGRDIVAAYARWDLAVLDPVMPTVFPRHEDMPAEEMDAFYASMHSERRRIMGGERHYYLSSLGTRPDYQRRGAASMLIQWGCDLADKDGVDLYVYASRLAVPLYERFGFVDMSEGAQGAVGMVRRH